MSVGDSTAGVLPAVHQQPTGEGERATAVARARPLVATFGPAAAVLLAQQVLFPTSAGMVVRGLILGALTALIAVGMALVYRANRIINFAQADLGFAPTVLAFLLMTQSSVPYGVALAVGLAVAVVLGAATERFVIRRFFRAPRLLVTIATIGLAQVLVGAALLLPRLWDMQLVGGRISAPFTATRRIGGVNFDANDLLGLVAAPMIVAAVALFLQRSDTGVAVRASAEAPDRASLLGVPVHRLQMLVWTLASALAFVTVFLRSGIVGLPTAGSALGLGVLLRALVALLLGRMGNLVAVASAAVALGALEQGVVMNHGDTLVPPVLGVVVAVAVVVRHREVGRRDTSEDAAWRAAEEVRPVPPELASLRPVEVLRWTVLAVVAVAALALPMVMSIDQTFKAATLLCFALLGLSLVLLSGWGGIVSLGHIAYFAVGAAVTGYLVVDRGVPLLVAFLAAAVAGGTVAMVVGAPALRLRGIYLAVTSFAFAIATAGYLLDRDHFSWVPSRSDRIVGPLLGSWEVETEKGAYYLILVVVGLVVLALRNLRSSRFGRALVALRDNDRAAQAYSIDPAWVQLCAFVLSGAVAALAGGLFAFKQRTFDSASFGVTENLAVFIMVVIGGLTSATGAILGALYLWGTKWFLPTEWQALAQGAGVIVVLLLFPGGLASVVFGVRDRVLRTVARVRKLDVAAYARTGPETTVAGSVIDPEAPRLDDAVSAVPDPSSPPAPDATDAEESDSAVLLEAEDVRVSYGDVPVLFGVDLRVDEGEAVALLGTNGAGKSTLLRAISGLVALRSGEVRLGREAITGRSPHHIAARGLLQMPGGQGIFPGLTVAENLRVAGWLHRRDRQAVASGIERAEQLFPVLAERRGERAGNLSGGQQQMLALSMTVLGRPRLLMIDELSLGLAPAVVGELLRFVDHLRVDGTTLLIVEQSVNLALELADRAVFLERGEVRFSGPARQLLDRPDLLRSVFLSRATQAPAADQGAVGPSTPSRPSPPPQPRQPVVSPSLVLDGLTVSYGGVRAVDHVSLEVGTGEIVGVIGPNGAGKTTLFDLVSGFVPAEAGRLLLAGQDITSLRAPARARRGLGRSFQDARLFPSLTVDETIAAALERWVEVGDPLSTALRLPNAYDSELAVRRRVHELVELLGLGPYRWLFVGELSTGTRRVVDLACLVAHRPSVVLLDEPAAGIAQREVEQLGPLIRRIRDETNASVVVVEHDIPLVEQVADRLVAMDRGRVLASGRPSEVLADPAVVSSYLGEDEGAIRRSGGRHSSSRSETVARETSELKEGNVIRATEQ
jgi:ABC-type branched-subunit amino acid transport system ATPase component/ABC-type branched-subunit amino acid transport system permease subunit